LPFVVARKHDGATTVAATMIIAAMAGIRVFATGGIGGVHRGVDISADLEELAHTNVAVVCAGIKSVLDIGRTLEYLETHGVPVVGYQTDTLPAFYARESDFGVDYRADTPADVADRYLPSMPLIARRSTRLSTKLSSRCSTRASPARTRHPSCWLVLPNGPGAAVSTPTFSWLSTMRVLLLQLPQLDRV
jgi:hypothetical protein